MQDAAAAALFTACKVEDTLKKSKDILVAAYNLRASAGDRITTDDPIIEMQSRSIIGLERQMLECSGFDFRNRHPQKTVLKLIKYYRFDEDSQARQQKEQQHQGDADNDDEDTVMQDATQSNNGKSTTTTTTTTPTEKCISRLIYKMTLDLYRTYAPLKQTTPTMAFACLELTSRLCNLYLNKPPQESSLDPITAAFFNDVDSGEAYARWSISRAEVMETMLDLLELYTHHRNLTNVGPEFESELFLRCRIPLNKESEEKGIPRFGFSKQRVVGGGDAAAAGGGINGDSSGDTNAAGYEKSVREFGNASVEGTPRSKAVTPINGTPGGTSSTASRYLNGSSSGGTALVAPNGMLVNPLMPRPAYDVPEKLPNGALRDGTLRYVLDPEEAKVEKETVARYFDVEVEEYEAER